MPPEIKKEIAGTFSIGTDKTKEEEEPQSRLVAGSMVTIGIVAVGTSGMLMFAPGVFPGDGLTPFIFLNASMYFLAAMLAMALALIKAHTPKHQLAEFKGTLTEEDG